VARQAARKVSKDEGLQKVADAVVKGEEEDAAKLTKEALQKKSPMEVINEGLIPGMKG
jgi:methanol corrinoid protein